jgi:hypothetical protein
LPGEDGGAGELVGRYRRKAVEDDQGRDPAGVSHWLRTEYLARPIVGSPASFESCTSAHASQSVH